MSWVPGAVTSKCPPSHPHSHTGASWDQLLDLLLAVESLIQVRFWGTQSEDPDPRVARSPPSMLLLPRWGPSGVKGRKASSPHSLSLESGLQGSQRSGAANTDLQTPVQKEPLGPFCS